VKGSIFGRPCETYPTLNRTACYLIDNFKDTISFEEDFRWGSRKLN